MLRWTAYELHRVKRVVENDSNIHIVKSGGPLQEPWDKQWSPLYKTIVQVVIFALLIAHLRRYCPSKSTQKDGSGQSVP